MNARRFVLGGLAQCGARIAASQVERATLGLREMLLRGDFSPGQRIAEIPLIETRVFPAPHCAWLSNELEHEGLVRALPNSGFAAREFSLSDIWDATRGSSDSGGRGRQACGGAPEPSRRPGTIAQNSSCHGPIFGT